MIVVTILLTKNTFLLIVCLLLLKQTMAQTWETLTSVSLEDIPTGVLYSELTMEIILSYSQGNKMAPTCVKPIMAFVSFVTILQFSLT